MKDAYTYLKLFSVHNFIKVVKLLLIETTKMFYNFPCDMVVV
jgi:hypothetical protein